jgi:hypothetical protein
MFTLTISDKPVAITNANEEEARDLLMSEEFKDDLKVLWDGFASLNVRPATEEEKAEFEGADFDEDEKEDDEEEGPYIMFLVDVTDPDEGDEG